MADDEKLRKELDSMSGLGQSIFEKGMQQGMQQGIQQGMQQGILKGRWEERASLLERMLAAGVITPEQAEQFAN